MIKNVEITTPISSTDFQLFTSIVNMGIDSYLEGFTASTFKREGNRYKFVFAACEVGILIRRLKNIPIKNTKLEEAAESWHEIIHDYLKYPK